MPASPPTLTLLFIQATPPDLDSLDIASEQRNLVQVLQKARFGGSFRVEWLHAARIQDIADGLRRYRPQIVHFSGHGDSRGHLALNAPDGQETEYLKAAEFAAIVRLYQKEASARIDLMVLAGCYTAAAGLLTAEHVGCVVAMGDSVNDEGIAQIFTPELYAALADGRSVKNAVESARLALGREHPLDVEAVHILPDGADAGRLVLTDLAAQRAVQGELSELHLEYLRYWFGRPWAQVKLADMLEEDRKEEINLLDVYVPLRVDLNIIVKVEDHRIVDWWVRQEREEMIEQRELARALAAEPGQTTPGNLEKLATKVRSWNELGIDEAGMQPIIDGIQRKIERRQAEGEATENGEHSWFMEAQDAASVQPRFVLLGAPGGGKSSFLRHLTLCLAGELRRRSGDGGAPARANLAEALNHDWLLDAFTPIYVEVRDLVGKVFPPLPEKGPLALPGLEHFWRYVREQILGGELSSFMSELRQLCAAGRVVLLLDGLDEAPQAADDRRRRQIKALITSLEGAYPDLRIVVTSRPHAYRRGDWALPKFGRAELHPLEMGRLFQLAMVLFVAVQIDAAEEEAKTFITAVRNEQIEESMRGTPLFFTMLAALWLNSPPGDRRLPQTKPALYRRSVDLLLDRWTRRRVPDPSVAENLGLDAEGLRAVLETLACTVHEQSEPGQDTTIFKGRELAAILYEADVRVIPQDISDYLSQHVGILVADAPNEFHFVHRSFQEHLAACELIHPKPTERRPSVAPDRLFPHGIVARATSKPDLWENVLLLAAEELWATGRSEAFWQLLTAVQRPYLHENKALQLVPMVLQLARGHKLLQNPPSDGDDLWLAPAQLAAQQGRLVLHHTSERALADHKTLTPLQRQVAGQLLGDDPFPGHDPRPGVLLRPDRLPDIAWVLIPKIDPQAGKSDWIYQDGKRQPEPIPDFWIARYPITYAQFQTFLDAPEGFRQAKWWQGLAASQSHRSSPNEQRFQHWNHPRENVSWYDAIAFCRWLTAQARKTPDLLPAALQGSREWQITLPTEWQWEKAARGHDGRQYPWGQGYRSGWANVDETEKKDGPYYLQQTSAVGMYPHAAPAASPYGVADLSGNVWEWCLNEYEKPERVQPEGSEGRVLRGGSWYSHPGLAASAVRSRISPDSRSHNRGFRVVAVRSSAP